VHPRGLTRRWNAGPGERAAPSLFADVTSAVCTAVCVLASRSALVRSAQLTPEPAARLAAVEARIGHRFRLDVSMAEIVAEAAVTPGPPKVAC
jgi:hypothetical protein